MKKWSERFKKPLSNNFKKLTYSFDSDNFLIKQEIKCLKAHNDMLFKQNLISKKSRIKIKNCLNEINKSSVNKKSNSEDIHFYVESILIKKLGSIGEQIRMARSRNDLVTTDLKMWIKNKIKKIFVLLKKIIKLFLLKSKQNIGLIMPGFTHLQIAQPVTFSHYLLCYCEMFLRDLFRLKNIHLSNDCMPLGSCAVSGTNFNTNRFFLAKKLGFKKINRNSIDSVSDRDYVFDFLYCNSVIMVHISRLSEELILWSGIINFVELPDQYCSGSSIMPQKKNPDSLEVIRAKSSRIISNLFSMLSIMKSLPLAYNKDYQEDKSLVFETYNCVKISLKTIKSILKKIKVNKKKMLNFSKKNYSTSTDIADYLTMKGVPFVKSHNIVSKIVRKSIEENIELKKIKLSFLKGTVSKNKIIKLKKFILKNNVEKSVKNKKSIGGTCFLNNIKEIERIKKYLINYKI
ncbi:argininosuccinate lyase [Candidatus Vidania fulgoroideorum]